jgi:hypothetical protein
MSSDFSDDSVSASDDEQEQPQAPHRGNGAQGNGVAATGAAEGDAAAGAGAVAAAASRPPGAAAAAAADRDAEAAVLAGELSHNAALLQVQVNDLLSEVRPAPLKGSSVQGVVQQLRGVLAAIKPREVRACVVWECGGLPCDSDLGSHGLVKHTACATSWSCLTLTIMRPPPTPSQPTSRFPAPYCLGSSVTWG